MQLRFRCVLAFHIDLPTMFVACDGRLARHVATRASASPVVLADTDTRIAMGRAAVAPAVVALAARTVLVRVWTPAHE